MKQPSLDLGTTSAEFSLIGNDHQTRLEAEQWAKQATRRPARAWYTLWAFGCHSVQLTVWRKRNGQAPTQDISRAFWDELKGWQYKNTITRQQAAREIRAHRNSARRGEPQTGAERTC